MSSEKSPLKIIREEIRSISAYKVQDAENLMKLDAMENPFDLPSAIRENWIKKISGMGVNRYPDPHASRLKEKLRKQLALPKGFDLLFGNGSDELIQILMMAVDKPDAKILSLEPGFVMYRMIAKFCRLKYIGIDLKSDFSIDGAAVEKAIVENQPELIFIAQPNNPTGNLFPLEMIENIIIRSGGLVVIDEAYTAFADFDALQLLKKYDNVVLLRTFSKMGLAGLRLGFLIGRSDLVVELDKLRLPYNINSLTQSLAECAIENFEALSEQCDEIVRLRARLVDALGAIPELRIFPSEANFVAIRIEDDGVSADEILEGLKEKGVLVKNLHGSHPLLENCLRLTVGTEEENSALVSGLKSLI